MALTAAQQQRIAELRAIGASLSHIADDTGISLSAIKLCIKKYGLVKSALPTEILNNARKKLLDDHANDLQTKIITSIENDLAASKKIQDAAAALLDELLDSELPPHIKSRSLAAIATSLAIAQQLSKKAIGYESKQTDNLPVLEIRGMTDHEHEHISAVINHDGLDIIDESIIDDR